MCIIMLDVWLLLYHCVLKPDYMCIYNARSLLITVDKEPRKKIKKVENKGRNLEKETI
jgi:hypothetical protein